MVKGEGWSDEERSYVFVRYGNVGASGLLVVRISGYSDSGKFGAVV